MPIGDSRVFDLPLETHSTLQPRAQAETKDRHPKKRILLLVKPPRIDEKGGGPAVVAMIGAVRNPEENKQNNNVRGDLVVANVW